jgi:hypothetical protein
MWILLIFYISNLGHSPSSQMAVEFNSKEACLAAAADWKRQFSEPSNLKTFCAHKGEKK